MKVDFYKHNVGIDEKENVLNTLDSLFLTKGPKTKEFETKYSQYFGCEFLLEQVVGQWLV